VVSWSIPATAALGLAFNLNSPPREGGWIPADMEGGWTCCVYQGHYGHFSGKPTWLYANGDRAAGTALGQV
jgi:hypothetical protein